MFAGKGVTKVVQSALKKFESTVAQYLVEHPKAKRQDVADLFGVSIRYVDDVIRKNNIERRLGRPKEK